MFPLKREQQTALWFIPLITINIFVMLPENSMDAVNTQTKKPPPYYWTDTVPESVSTSPDKWRVYLRVEEIFTLAADYEPSNKETTRFFQTIQNKLYFAWLLTPGLCQNRTL